jgi:soluble lytic murein transglycosylase
MEGPSGNILTPRPFCGTKRMALRLAGRLALATGLMLFVCSVSFAAPRVEPAPTKRAAAALKEKQLEKLARLLKTGNSSWAYGQLSAIAADKSSGVLAMRAALALGYFDYAKEHYAQAEKWFAQAKRDPLLGDYALYWSAENNLALGHDPDALAELQLLRKNFPDSVMTEQALESLGTAALALQRPGDVVAALDAYPATPQSPALLFLRGQAHEQAGETLDAAADYEAVYTRFSMSEQARQADQKLKFLRATPGANIPPLPLDVRLARADALFAAENWNDARDEYADVLQSLSGPSAERAQLRTLECGLSLGSNPSELIALPITDPDVDAERSYALANFYRNQQQEAQTTAAVEAAVARAPSSQWAEEALFLAGNYYWIQLDRDRAASFYQRLDEKFPTSADATAAQWRVTWTAVLKRAPEGAELLQDHLNRFPGSIYTPDALYWLGRLAEEAGVAPLARSYYEKLTVRFPQNYFAYLGSARLQALGTGPTQDPVVLKTIPALPDPPSLDKKAIPASAAGRQARADALRSIAFDSSAQLELEAGYAASGEPRLLLEAAQAAIAADQYSAAIVLIRQLFPQLGSQSFSEVPPEVWRIAYALPYESSIRRWSRTRGLDPMLVAGLIHQESAFQPNARSVSDAIGLMQLLPGTARDVAKRARTRYSRMRLIEPDYNVKLGTAYLADLRKQFDTVEEAVAAYNAGENRVVSWTTGQNYRETAEFVESIPITQTRQYVQIVTRNANIYRRLYGAQTQNEPRTSRTGHGR